MPLLKAEDNDKGLSHETFGQAVKVAEDRLRSGLQRFPNDPFLLSEEANLSEILKNADRALRALQKAFEKNSKSELLARRYARVLIAKRDTNAAIDVLRRGLDSSPGSHRLHYAMARAIQQSAPDADVTQSDALLHHFQRSFSTGDKNYEAQFWYARQLCIDGQQSKAKTIFDALDKTPVPYKQRRSVRGELRAPDGELALHYGLVTFVSNSLGFIRSDFKSIEAYFSVGAEQDYLQALQVNDRVSFNLGFSLAGPVGINLAAV